MSKYAWLRSNAVFALMRPFDGICVTIGSGKPAAMDPATANVFGALN